MQFFFFMVHKDLKLINKDSLRILTLLRTGGRRGNVCNRWVQKVVCASHFLFSTDRFQDEDLRGWNPCRKSALRTFGWVYLQSARQTRALCWCSCNSFYLKCRSCALTSFRLNPWRLISSTLLILQPWQNSAVSTLCGGGTWRWGSCRRRVIFTTGSNLTLLVCSQNTLGTTTKWKCFSSSAHLSEFLASFSKSSSWARVAFRSCRDKQNKNIS